MASLAAELGAFEPEAEAEAEAEAEITGSASSALKGASRAAGIAAGRAVLATGGTVEEASKAAARASLEVSWSLEPSV